jgi:glycosidase
MTYLGAPMIYYGDEAGMWGANDPCCRKPMIWDDLNFDAELFLPNQAIREQPDVVEVNADLSIHYQKLIKIRNEQLALQLGDFKTILADDKNDIYAFSRNYKNESIVVVLNNKKMRQAVELLVDVKKFVDLLNGNEYILPEGKRLKIELPAKWARILKKV